jgi:hypothetical protein
MERRRRRVSGKCWTGRLRSGTWTVAGFRPRGPSGVLRPLFLLGAHLQTAIMQSRIRLTLLAASIAVVVYARYVRPWQLTWGATPDEVSRALPGDDLVTRPTFNATRAITIAAPPEVIWPWLIQVGLTRAGWYSYDILDNLGHRSARRIIPEFQNLAAGDVVPMSPDGKQGMRVHSLVRLTP